MNIHFFTVKYHFNEKHTHISDNCMATTLFSTTMSTPLLKSDSQKDGCREIHKKIKVLILIQRSMNFRITAIKKTHMSAQMSASNTSCGLPPSPPSSHTLCFPFYSLPTLFHPHSFVRSSGRPPVCHQVQPNT